MKKVLLIFLSLSLLLFCGCSRGNSSNNGINESNSSGEKTMFFGNYNGEDIEWIVLEDGDKKLLLSKYVLEATEYCDSWGVSNWSQSKVSRWLNDEFLDSAFDDVEASKLTYGTIVSDNGEYENEELVFSLDTIELGEYSSKLGCELYGCYPTSYVAENYDSILLYDDENGYDGQAFYWERSEQVFGSYLMPTSLALAVVEYDEQIAGIRPAIWIND